MALVKCPECNKEFSEHADCCPNCGCPMSVIKKQQEEKKLCKKLLFRNMQQNSNVKNAVEQNSI